MKGKKRKKERKKDIYIYIENKARQWMISTEEIFSCKILSTGSAVLVCRRLNLSVPVCVCPKIFHWKKKMNRMRSRPSRICSCLASKRSKKDYIHVCQLMQRSVIKYILRLQKKKIIIISFVYNVQFSFFICPPLFPTMSHQAGNSLYVRQKGWSAYYMRIIRNVLSVCVGTAH